LQVIREERTLPYMRTAAIAAALLAAGPALAGRLRASFHVGAEVVSSARVVATASAAGLGIESRSFGGSGAAVLLEQRSGAPMRLSDGTWLPREGQRPLVVPAAAGLQMALAPAAGGAEVVVTLFPDGAPPLRN
jgi:hypothetical protein